MPEPEKSADVQHSSVNGAPNNVASEAPSTHDAKSHSKAEEETEKDGKGKETEGSMRDFFVSPGYANLC